MNLNDFCTQYDCDWRKYTTSCCDLENFASYVYFIRSVRVTFYLLFSDASKSRLLSDDDETWGSWGGEPTNEWNGTEGKTKSQEDEFEAWLNDDSSGGSSKNVNNHQSSNPEWDDWIGGKSNKSDINKPVKPGASAVADDGWNEPGWDTGLTAKPKMHSEPKVGPLIDLGDDDNGAEKTGWDNEVWANEEDEWQSLETDSSMIKKAGKAI